MLASRPHAEVPCAAARPVYVFTCPNDHKPTLSAEATRNARAGADQFTRDSGAVLGGVRQASQGVFQVLPRNETPGATEAGQPDKRLRVVATVEYQLCD